MVLYRDHLINNKFSIKKLYLKLFEINFKLYSINAFFLYLYN
jgi:hypothetical protein